MTHIIFAGECMVEFRQVANNNYARSFAGDVYNTCVYAKRILDEKAKVSFFTALGIDQISKEMLDAWHDEKLDTSLVYRSKDTHPGAYMIETDSQAERHFVYWRNNSSARQAMQLFCDSGDKLTAPSLFYFSGISLAILSQSSREILFEMISELKKQKVKIVFDPNYRSSLWNSVAEAQYWINRAYTASDMALPGFDDEAELFSLTEPKQMIARFQAFDIEEIVLKAGKLGVFGVAQGETFHAPFASPAILVDTTAAGDSFDAMYLARRVQGYSPKASAIDAAMAASFVVGYTGAIVPKAAFEKWLHRCDC